MPGFSVPTLPSGGIALQLGIPFIPNLSPPIGCAPGIGPGPAVTEAWWSCDGFRRGFEPTFIGAGSDAWSACYNGAILLSSDADASHLNLLRLFPPAIATTIPFNANPSVPRTLLRASIGSGALYADPVIGWGIGPLSADRLRGQLWNCVMPTKDAALDGAYTVDGINFVNYMHDGTGNTSKWSSLYLLTSALLPAATGLGNYVY